MLTLEEILKEVDDVAIQLNIVYRNQQKETIIKIIYYFLHKKHENIVLNAPLGSGKSIIALVVSIVMRNNKKSAYILTSNIDLQKQYENSIKQYKVDIPSIMGKGNYRCDVNNKTVDQGECNYFRGSRKDLECYKYCNYYMSYNRVKYSEVSVLNYSLWLIKRNYNKIENIEFPKRYMMVYDEAHKIDDILQSHFSFTYSTKIGNRVIDTIKQIKELQINFDYESINLTRLMLINATLLNKAVKKINIDNLKKLKDFLFSILDAIVPIHEYVNKKYKFGDVPNDVSKLYKNLNFIEEMYRNINNYLKQIYVDESVYVKTNVKIGVVKYQLLKDDILAQEKLHNHANYSLFMSGTFGNVKEWAKNIGLHEYKEIVIKNTWDYSKSPIFIIKNAPKLNFKEKDANWCKSIKIVDNIIYNHVRKNEKGIIFTGNFEFTNKLLEDSKFAKLFHYYLDRKEKIKTIEEFKYSKRGILIGPSLYEGLDLKNEISRFQIFLKLPCRSILDEYVKAKMELFKKWYDYKTLLNLEQGSCRSIRSEGDWAATYLVDGSFNYFVSNNIFNMSDNLKDRLQYY